MREKLDTHVDEHKRDRDDDKKVVARRVAYNRIIYDEILVVEPVKLATEECAEYGGRRRGQHQKTRPNNEGSS